MQLASGEETERLRLHILSGNGIPPILERPLDDPSEFVYRKSSIFDILAIRDDRRKSSVGGVVLGR